MTDDEQVELVRWIRSGSGTDHDRQVQHELRQGGARADLIRLVLAHPQRPQGASPDDKQVTPPQLK